jgi:hypothetical protein
MVEEETKTTPQPPRIEQIFAEIKAFEALQSKYRNFGANDTEPDGVFQRLLDRAIKGEGPAIPRTGAGWDLYDRSMDCTEAANALHDQALKIVQLIEGCPVREIANLQNKLRDYCWRLY